MQVDYSLVRVFYHIESVDMCSNEPHYNELSGEISQIKKEFTITWV